MRTIILLTLFLLSTLFSIGQSTEFYKYEQALANNNVRSLEEDNSGNIWIGTIGGITKFDGTNFTTYTSDDGLGGNIVYDIMVKPSGEVYAATSGGLSVFNGTSWSNYNLGDGLPSNSIWSVDIDNSGKIWIGTADMGVAYYDGTNWTGLNTNDGLISNGVKVAYADRNNNIWFGTGNGVSMYDGSTFSNFNNTTGLPGLLVNDIIQLYNGNILLATNGGLAIYDFNSWTTITTADGLPASNILGIREDYNQNIWIASATGLTKYDGTNFTTWGYNEGLTDEVASKLLITSAGDNKIWVGSPFDGLSVFDYDDDFIIYKTNKTLVNDTITTIYTDNEDVTWIGTKSGLNRVKDMHWRTYGLQENLSDLHITAIHKDNNDNIWVGTVNGLNLLDGDSFQKYTTNEGLTSNYINSISSDPTGKVYVATNDKVIVLLNNAVNDTIDTNDGLLNNEVKQIHFENNRLWFLQDAALQVLDGTYNDATLSGCALQPTSSGAKCLNNIVGQYFGTNKTLRYYENGLTTSNCFIHPFSNTATITSIVEIGTNIYCAFNNGNIQAFDGTNWTAFTFPEDASFISSSLDKNYLWVGTEEKGIAKVCLSCNQTITYTPISPTCHETLDGSIIITSPTGAAYSIDNGANWSPSPSFSNLNGGFKHILVRDASSKIIADSIIYLPFYQGIDDACITIEQMLCHGDNNARVELSYSNAGNHIWENGNNTLYVRENLTAGNYSVTVSDGTTCSRVLNTNIIEPSELNYSISHNNITCYGLTNGEISVTPTGGTLPYSYNWNNGESEAEITELSANTYAFTVSDANMCSVSGTQEITAPTPIEITSIIQNAYCFGESNGGINVTLQGGTLPYTVVWDSVSYVSNNDIVNAPAGIYSITVTDANLCTTDSSFEISQPSQILITSEDITNILCNGDATGAIDISLSGGVTPLLFEWSKEGTAGSYANTEDLNNLTQGTYHLTISDQNNCEINADYEITEPPALDVNLTVTPITCSGYDDGQILAEATGGSGNYSSYYWYNENNDIIGVNAHITNLAPGTYKVVVRDSHYCEDSATTSLNQATPHTYNISATNMSCNGLENGEIEIIIDGGTGTGFTFNWENSIAGNVNTAQNLGVGEYSVTVTDPTNCEEILSAEIQEPYMLDIGAFNDVEYLCYGEDLELNPGTFTSYLWSTGDITQSITVSNEDVYFVEVVNSDGCHLGDTVELVVSTVYNDEQINLASVNNDTEVTLYWEKTPNEGTHSYNIYRNSGNGFQLITNKPYNENAIFLDTNLDTENQYYSYKITSVDSCGAESDYSDIHRTCLLEVVADNNGACLLNWSEYEGFFVVYYFILRGTSPDNLQVVDSTLYDHFNWAEMNPNTEGTYYQIMVRRIDGCSPGDGNYYDRAYSNIVYCDNYTGMVNKAIVSTEVFPNPFNDQLKLSIDFNIPGYLTYSFYNMLGQEIVTPQKIAVNQGEQEINIIPQIERGVYILKLKFANEEYNIRVIKE